MTEVLVDVLESNKSIKVAYDRMMKEALEDSQNTYNEIIERLNELRNKD